MGADLVVENVQRKRANFHGVFAAHASHGRTMPKRGEPKPRLAQKPTARRPRIDWATLLHRTAEQMLRTASHAARHAHKEPAITTG